MKIIKRNPAAIAGLLALIIIGISAAGIIGASDNGTMYLRDMEGNRQVLNDVLIRGILQDKYHGQIFSIDKGEISQDFNFYDNQSDMVIQIQEPMGNTRNIDKMQYYQQVEAEPAGNMDISSYPWNPEEHTQGNTEAAQPDYIRYTKEVISTDKVALFMSMNIQKLDGMDQAIRVNTGVYFQSDKKDFQFDRIYFIDEREKNPVPRVTSEGKGGPGNRTWSSNKAFTFINGKLFFTVLTDETASGSNGIFRVDEWDTWPNWGETQTYGKVEKICDVSLDNHDTEVLGLENVDNKLVMYMLVDNVLTFRAYEPDSGKLIDELKVKGFQVNGFTETSGIPNYQTFNDGSSLIVWFGGRYCRLVNVKLDNKLSVEHIVNPIDLISDSGEADILMPQNVKTVNDKLFVFAYLTDEFDDFASVYLLKRRQFMVMVYDKSDDSSQLLYKGEIVSDANQDTEYDRQNKAAAGGYSPSDYRQFEALDVKSR